jgi:hypothetical protein
MRSGTRDALRIFRDSLYECFDCRTDALFRLADALLTAGMVHSPIHLSLESSHQRSWSSLYAPLSHGGSTRRRYATCSRIIRSPTTMPPSVLSC